MYIRKAIRDFKLDVVYAEFRIAAIVASKLENINVVTRFSYPVSKFFASNPEYSTGVKRFIRKTNYRQSNQYLIYLIGLI